jgi:hypothetical protein
VTISGGGGSGATGVAVSGPVTGLTVVNGGTGYTTAPAITFESGGGVGATATATITAGVVTAVTITNPGSGYTSAPTVRVTAGHGGAGATVAHQASQGKVVTVLQDLAQKSAQAGVYVAFDVVVSGSGLVFRTYAGQRGTNHRWPSGSPPIVLGAEAGTLATTERAFVFSDQTTAAYVGGQGEGTARDIVTAMDTPRIGLSPFGRIETFTSSQSTTADALTDDASAALRRGRPRKTFTGTVVETFGLAFGLDYGFGDYLTAAVGEEQIDCLVEMVHLTVNDGVETIDVQLRSEA